MGSNDEFGPDTESIRAWLDKRASYADDARITGAPRGGSNIATTEEPPLSAASRSSAPPLPSDVDSTSAGRDVLSALGVEGPTPTAEDPGPSSGPDVNAAGRAVVDALRADMAPAARPAAPAPPPADKRDRHRRDRTTKASVRATHRADPRDGRARAMAAGDPVTPDPPARVRMPPEVQHGRWTEPEENRTGHLASTDADFPPRGGARKVLSILLALVFAAAAAAGWLAYQEPTTTSVGIAGTLGLLLLVVWAVWAGTTTTQLSVHRGQLTIRQHGLVQVVDIASPYTPVAMVGEPGDRRWTVLIERPDRPLVIITRSMVDPHWFTSVLYRLRPSLRPEAQETDGDAG